MARPRSHKAKRSHAPRAARDRPPSPASAAAASTAMSANASVWPIQLRDVQPRGQPAREKRLPVVQIDEVEFEEVSFPFHFARILQLVTSDDRRTDHPGEQGSSSPSVPNGSDAENLTDKIESETSFPSSVERDGLGKGKRRAQDPDLDALNPRQSKYPKLDAAGSNLDQQSRQPLCTTLIDTACIFKVEARTSNDKAAIMELLGRLRSSYQESLAVGPVSLSVHTLTRSEPSIFSHVATLRDPASGSTLAALPLIDTYRFEASSRPDQYTNSNWIASAAQLLEVGDVAVETSLYIVEPPAGLQPHQAGRTSLFVKLCIRVTVPLAHDAGTLRASVIKEHALLLRFADQYGTEQDEADRRKRVNAKLVMDHLRPSQLRPNDHIQPEDLNPILLPFQRRSTAFILGREGKSIGEDGKLHDVDNVVASDGRGAVGLWWKQVGEDLYYHFLQCRYVQRAELTLSSNLHGAMLAEEMGLGKTVEVIALILLHPRLSVHTEASWMDAENEIEVHPTKTTLIIAPETLRKQWIDELALHAPHLQVYSYTSRSAAENDTPKELDWVRWASRLDVIVTSYTVLATELNTARKEPARPRRQPRKYERPRSPLIRLHFHRVIMDEVQMVGNSHAAETAAMISRGSSLAVSGTPIKKIDDLKACFRFLRVPCCEALTSPTTWNKILSPQLAPVLISVLRTIATRHTKVQVANEMSLPPQTRSVVPIDFTAIEAAFYADVWRDALHAVQIDADGKPLVPNWELDLPVLRSHLLLLRQACTHPQVAVNAKGGMVGGHNLRSIDEVLELMVDSTKSDLQSSRGSLFDKRILKAILALYYREDAKHVVVEAQLLDLEQELRQEIAQLETDVGDAQRQGPLYRFSDHELQLEQQDERLRETGAAPSPGDDELALSSEPSKNGSAEWQKLCLDPDFAERRRQRASYVIRIKQVLRYMYLRLHRVLQFKGNLYFQRGTFADSRDKEADSQGKAADPRPNACQDASDDAMEMVAQLPEAATEAHGPDVPTAIAVKEEGAEASGTTIKEEDPADGKQDRPIEGEASSSNVESDEQKGKGTETNELLEQLKKKEDQAYQAAEELRQHMLTEHRTNVEHAVKRLESTRVDFGKEALLCDATAFDEGGGIATSDMFETLARNCRLLDRHADVLFAWRDSIIARLKRPVNRDINLDNDEDDQYQENLDTQAEAEALLEMYRPLIAEREMILSGTVAMGATAKPQLYAELEAALRFERRRQLMAQSHNDEGGDAVEETEVVRVQKQQLQHFKQLDKERKEVSLSDPSDAFPSMRARLKDVIDGEFPEQEIALAKRGMAAVRKITGEQNRLLAKIKTEAQTMLAPLFNERSTYFKEMQVLSDSVGDPNFSDLDKSIHTAASEEMALRAKVEGLEGRLRYLIHLGSVQKVEAKDNEEARRCFICTESITMGVLTNACGHVCCERCFKEWQGQGHRSCPMCKTRVLPTEVHRIVYTNPSASNQPGSSTLNASHTIASSSDASGDTAATARYNLISPSYRTLVSQVAIQGRFGSKIDLLTSHISHLYRSEGAKSIVFSSFTRGLDVISQSLRANGLRYIRLTGGGKHASRAASSFREPGIAAMLLHSEAQAAGLNLIAASHIHILEPFLDRSRELQAVGRVHRIGQTRETYVWVYKVNDTVEQRVLDAATKRGESLYLSSSAVPAASASASATTAAAAAAAAAAATTVTDDPDAAERDGFATGPAKRKRARVEGHGLKGDWARDRQELVEVFCEGLARRLGEEEEGAGTGTGAGAGGASSSSSSVAAAPAESAAAASSGAARMDRDETDVATTSVSTPHAGTERERERALRLEAIRRRMDPASSGAPQTSS